MPASVFGPEVKFTILQPTSRICVSNNAQYMFTIHISLHVYNSDGFLIAF